MSQVKNRFFSILLMLTVFGCDNHKESGFHNSSNAQHKYVLTDDEIQNSHLDSIYTDKQLYSEVALEYESIYQFISKKANVDLYNICSVFRGKTIIIHIHVSDSLITHVYGRVYEFDKLENLIYFDDDAYEFTSLFLNIDAKKFDFIDVYTNSPYLFRVEVDELCEFNDQQEGILCELSETPNQYLKKQVDGINKIYIDSSHSTRQLLSETALESESVYQLIANKANTEISKVCSMYMNKTVIIHITVKDTMIIEGKGSVYEFDSSGNLICYYDDAFDFASFFINIDAKKIDFIDSYNLSHYTFRVETSRICK